MTGLLGPLLGTGLLLGQAAPPSPSEVLEVPPALASQVEQLASKGVARERDEIDRLADFFREKDGLDFEYRAHPTRTVGGTYAAGEGNCLAFTLTFMMLARQLGLEAHAREVRVPDQWQRKGSSVLSVGHVNVGVETPGRVSIVDFEPDLMNAQRLAQPFRGRRISDERALAHFYNNRAAELIVAEREDAARAWVEQSLAMDDGFAPAWITSGVLARREGRLQAAERHFRAALERDERSFNALVNLVSLKRQTGERAAMIRYGRRLEELAPDDPYLHWELGRLYSDLDELELARDRFERAVRLSDEQDPSLLTSLAATLMALGEREKANRYLTRSMALESIDGAGRSPYDPKTLKKRL